VKKKILVVDDEHDLRVILGSELEEQGYSVATAEDGEVAIHMLRGEHFDLILLDNKMPRVDGFGVLKYVKEHHPTTKVIMLTGFADLQNAIESKKLKAEGFINKPYEFDKLLGTVERVLGEV
jgi:DNA-binding NtrC family response regulator